MTPLQKNIEVKKSARYYTNNPDLTAVEEVWFLLHGYGQLAENFIKKFPLLDKKNNYLVAPEALSRFYTDNGFGKTGASWMTREERDSEIIDYTNYLSDLRSLIMKEIKREGAGLNIFAFSQGTSTACRWLQNTTVKADKLILWGGFLPPDFEIARWKECFNSLLIITGREDEYLPPEKLEEGRSELEKYRVKYSVRIFDGGHEMKEKVVNEALNSI